MMSYLIYIFLSLFLFTACDGGHDEEGGSARVLPIHIRIKTTEGPQQRVPGDPGEVEKFPLPNVAYIYVLANSAVDGTGAWLLQMINGAENKGKVTLDGEWKQDVNDPSIYHYGDALNISLWLMAQSAKVYVAVAHLENPDREIPGIALPASPEDIVSLTYDPSKVKGNVNEFMKNLYSTPYNKNKPVSADDATYYGTVKDLHTNTPSVNVMLYHVAARLDLKWNVEEERRKTFALGTLSVSDLPKSCYLFKPTENTDPGTGNGYSDIVVSKFDATTAWSGRKVVYVPQVNDGARNFPVNLSYTNAAASNAPGLKEQAFQYESDVFTTWFNVEANFVKN
jgi:hypothetical protein